MRKSLCFILILALVLAGTGLAFAGDSYTVKSGDVLWKIARQYDTTWQSLADYNKLANPHLIFPGQTIRIPDPVPVESPVQSTLDQAASGMSGLLAAPRDAYLAALDLPYAFGIANRLATDPAFHDSPLGTRTAGSDAEHRAADYLVSVMEDLGLSDVEKTAAKVDKWQFNGATLTLAGDSKVILPHSYATGATPKEGITAEIVYLGKGTMWDYDAYEGDVAGKIILVDVDMRADWWITYPMLEAEFQGAAAILCSAVSGFSEISKDAYNANDICGPATIPCANITVNDAEYIKKAIETQGSVTGTLVVDNVVEPGGTTYNITGRIPGKNSDRQILVGAHYDMYFQSFQDDSAAVGLVLAMAKAMKETGYVPENDIVFCLHGAEEWGATYSQFDWTIGAWRMINEVHPDWVGKTLAFLNFELPAYEFDTYTSVYSAPELYRLIDAFVDKGPAPEPVGCFPDGVLTEGYQTYTYSDDFSYYAAGVPSTVNGFLLQKDMESVFPFYYNYYHTNFDTAETYDEDVLRFNLSFYGTLAMFIDQMPALMLDLSAQCDRLEAALDEEVAAGAGGDTAAYRSAVSALRAAADAHNTAIDALNLRYVQAAAGGAGAQILSAIRAEADALNTKSLAVFKTAQDSLLVLMYERPVVPHEAPQENIALMQLIIEALEAGDVVTAADEYAWAVNNVFEWYAMYFSPEVMDVHYDMFYGADNQDNLFWGTGKAFVPADVEEATRSLILRYEEENGNFASEIAIYRASILAQQAILKDLLAKETKDVLALAAMLR